MTKVLDGEAAAKPKRCPGEFHWRDCRTCPKPQYEACATRAILAEMFRHGAPKHRLEAVTP